MKDDSLSDVVNEECICGRYHSNIEYKCYKCGKLVPVKKYENVHVEKAVMLDDNVGKQETYRLLNIDKAMEPSVFEKRIWNEAIEAVEVELHKKLKFPTEACAIVRGLKK